MLFVGEMLGRDLSQMKEMSLSELKLWLSYSEIKNEDKEEKGQVDILADPKALGYNGN